MDMVGFGNLENLYLRAERSVRIAIEEEDSQMDRLESEFKTFAESIAPLLVKYREVEEDARQIIGDW